MLPLIVQEWTQGRPLSKSSLDDVNPAYASRMHSPLVHLVFGVRVCACWSPSSQILIDHGKYLCCNGWG